MAPDGYGDQYKDAEVPKDLVELDCPNADWKANMGEYYGCIRRLDENLGEIVTVLKDKNIYEDTVIVFTSDHGSHFKTRNGEYKRSCHEASVRIPFVIRGGDYQGGKLIEHSVSLVDLAPTLLEVAGVESIEDMDGRGVGCLLGECNDWDDAVFIQISESQVARAIRTAKWKYSITAPQKDPWDESYADVYEEEFLYDLEKDPYELNNLITDSEYLPVKLKLCDQLLSMMEKAGEQRSQVIAN